MKLHTFPNVDNISLEKKEKTNTFFKFSYAEVALPCLPPPPSQRLL